MVRVEGMEETESIKIGLERNKLFEAISNFIISSMTSKTLISLISNAKFVVSNSFHAVAFSVIFNKQFVVFNRSENINTRMRDFVNLFDISRVLIQNNSDIESHSSKIDYELLTKN